MSRTDKKWVFRTSARIVHRDSMASYPDYMARVVGGFTDNRDWIKEFSKLSPASIQYLATGVDPTKMSENTLPGSAFRFRNGWV